jgi:hypothetical protein
MDSDARPASQELSPALRALGLFILLFLLLALLARPFRSERLYDWDAVQMALGAEDFDPVRHQPHPPGYTLWVGLLKLLHAVEPDLNTAQILLAQAFTAGAAVFVFLLGRRLAGPLTGACAALFLLAAPCVLQGALTPTTYPVDLFTSALVGWFAVCLYEGEDRLAPWAVAATALCAGVRLSGAVFMLPLLGLAVVHACRGKPRLWAATILAGFLATALWVVPLLQACGGYAEYERISQTQYTGAFTLTSVLYGASAGAHLRMAATVGTWYAAALAAPALLALALLLLRRAGVLPPPEENAATAPRAWRPAYLYALWLLPGLANNFLIHAPKCGYVLISLPPLMLLLGHAVAQGLGSLARRFPLGAAPVYGLAAVWIAGVGLALLAWPFEPPPLGRPSPWRDALYQDSLTHVRAADEDLREVLKLIREDPVPPAQACVVVYPLTFHSPNWRKLMWYLPQARVTYINYTLQQAQGHRTQVVREVAFPFGARRVWWLFTSASFPSALALAFPNARRVLLKPRFSLWCLDLPPGPVEHEAMCFGNRVRFLREAVPSPAPEL